MILWGLRKCLRHWMLCLIYEGIRLEDKKSLWEVVAIEQFTGRHEHCGKHRSVDAWRYAKDERHLQALKEFLQMRGKYLDKCGRLISTRMNESLHALKARYANKIYCWMETGPTL